MFGKKTVEYKRGKDFLKMEVSSLLNNGWQIVAIYPRMKEGTTTSTEYHFVRYNE